MNDPDAGKIAKQSFVVVSKTATLADVNDAMTRKQDNTKIACEDAFVVSPGGSRIEGWMTNDIIQQNSKV